MCYPLGEGSLSSEERLPVVGAITNGHLHDPRYAESSLEGKKIQEEDEDEEEEEVVDVIASSPLPSSDRAERTKKRFPILGPTRQETELYFRRRRSGRHRSVTRWLNRFIIIITIVIYNSCIALYPGTIYELFIQYPRSASKNIPIKSGTSYPCPVPFSIVEFHPILIRSI